MVDIRTARGQSERGGPAFGLTDPRRRQATSLFSRADQTSVIRPTQGPCRAGPALTSPVTLTYGTARGGHFQRTGHQFSPARVQSRPIRDSFGRTGPEKRKGGGLAGGCRRLGWVRPDGTGLFRRRAQAPRRFASSAWRGRKTPRLLRGFCDKAKSRNLSSLGLPGAVAGSEAVVTGMLLLKFCQVCERPLFAARPTREYCSDACKQRRYRVKKRASWGLANLFSPIFDIEPRLFQPIEQKGGMDLHGPFRLVDSRRGAVISPPTHPLRLCYVIADAAIRAFGSRRA